MAITKKANTNTKSQINKTVRSTPKRSPIKKTKTIKKTVKNTPTGVQNHGKIWENDILRNVYKIEPSAVAYTSAHDIPKEHNRINHKNISIKATGSNKVDFGDAKRIYNTMDKNTPSPLEVIVIKYKQDDNAKTKNIKEIVRLDLTGAKTNLFGTLPDMKGRIETLNGLVQTYNPDYKKYAKTLQKDMKSHGSFLTIAPKIGDISKKRSGRIQVSLSNINKYMDNNPSSVVERTTATTTADKMECSIHGCFIRPSINSNRRIMVNNRTNKTRKLSPVMEVIEATEPTDNITPTTTRMTTS